MFKCERCESQYSALHAAALENCPRCQIRDRVAAPLTLKVFQLPGSGERKARDPLSPAPEHTSPTLSA